MEWKLADLEIDPEFEQQIPGLTSDEFNQLKRNILADGKILTPLIVWGRKIIDGHNRYRILKKHPELPFTVTEIEFDDRYAAMAWICHHQLGRRNLTSEQKRYLIGKQYKSEKQSHGGSEHRDRDASNGQFTSSGQNGSGLPLKIIRASIMSGELKSSQRVSMLPMKSCPASSRNCCPERSGRSRKM